MIMHLVINSTYIDPHLHIKLWCYFFKITTSPQVKYLNPKNIIFKKTFT